MPFRPFAPFVVLVRIVRRDGFAVFSKAAKYALSPAAWAWLLRGGRYPSNARRVSDAEIATIRASRWFDPEWYLREYLDVRRAGIDPARHYATFGHLGHHDPGPCFCAQEYFELNEDVRFSKMNPLIHFERFGRRENRPFSFLQLRPSAYPNGAIETERTFPAASVRRHRRVAVFAAHSGGGVVPPSTLCYLRGLREVADEIVFVASNPVLPDEIAKLDGLVRAAVFRDHGGYDFLSYRIGFEKARELGLLDAPATDELILANDSCYAPVLPFPDCFAKMEARRCDFWGMASYAGAFGVEHVQSFFFVFRRPVLDSGALDRFLRGVRPLSNRWEIIRRYEIGLTAALSEAGHSWDTLVPRSFAGRRRATPTKRVLDTMRFGMPLVKVKSLDGDMADSQAAVLGFIRSRNPELAAAIPPPSPPPDYEAVRRVHEGHPLSFGSKIEAIRRDRVERGLPVRALFFVVAPSMFPARPLFEAMLRDPAFDARIVVPPDFRWPDRDLDADMDACAAELRGIWPDARIAAAARLEDGTWSDETADADIVCYSSPYSLSDFRYNPHWAVGRGFLPVYVSYSFSTSLYGYWVYGLQAYADAWKVLVECEGTAKEYAEHSILKGANAETVGYVKMDGLASAKPWPRNGDRRRVLVAPHHSVDGGSNDTLAFSNFERYADYFLSLPEKHPELDFVFRPHPFLFTVLSKPTKWGQAKVDGWIARMKAHPNVRWSDEGDYFPAFASCDAIVQDCGSFLAEWLYTGKPCCFLLKDPSDVDAKFSPTGRDCLSHCYLAYDEKQIESFLRDVVEGGADPKAAARDEFRKSVMVNYPNAADAALASIRRELGVH